MDEVWILSLCLSLFTFFLFILTIKPKEKPTLESISRLSASSSATAYSGHGGKNLEVDAEQVEKMMERLNKLLYAEAESKKKDVPQERKSFATQEKAEDSPRSRADVQNTEETQESMGRWPGHNQPAHQPSQHLMQKRSAPAPVENIMDEIEQAVQETVEPDYYARRRQERAAARTRQWNETDNQ